MATQQDVDDALADLNETIQKQRGLPPIKTVPDSIAKPPATQADVDAAMEDLNHTITTTKGAVAQTKKVETEPARPETLPYIGGQAQIGAATGGNNIAAANQAELYSMGFPVDAPDNKQQDIGAYNKEIYGGNGQVIAPNAWSRYAGAGVNALASNPLAALVGGPLTGAAAAIGGGMGSQAGSEFADAYLPDYLKPFASILGGIAGGGVGAMAPSAARATMRAVRPPAPPVKGIMPYNPKTMGPPRRDMYPDEDGELHYYDVPPQMEQTNLITGAKLTPSMMDDAHPQTMAVEKALRADPRTAPAFSPIDDANEAAMRRTLGQIENPRLKTRLDTNDLSGTDGKLDPEKVKAFITKMRDPERGVILHDDENYTHRMDRDTDYLFEHDVPPFVLHGEPDDLRLSHVSDLLSRQARLQGVTPANLSKEGVPAWRRYIGGDPSWLDFAAPQALSLIISHGDPHIGNALASVPYVSKLLGGQRTAATNRVRNDQAVRNLLQNYMNNPATPSDYPFGVPTP